MQAGSRTPPPVATTAAETWAGSAAKGAVRHSAANDAAADPIPIRHRIWHSERLAHLRPPTRRRPLAPPACRRWRSICCGRDPRLRPARGSSIGTVLRFVDRFGSWFRTSDWRRDFQTAFRDATTWASPLWCCHFQKSTASDVRSRLHYSRFPRGRHRGNERSAYGGAGSVPLLWGPLLDDAGQDRGQPCEEPLVAIISQDGYGIGGSVDLVVGFRS